MKDQEAYDPVAAGFKRVADAHDALRGYRASIDNIDAALIHMLAERFRCTKAVGAA